MRVLRLVVGGADGLVHLRDAAVALIEAPGRGSLTEADE
jgi:hypothetical protein